MTSNFGGRNVSVKFTVREWFAIFLFLTSGAVGFSAVYAQAKSVEAKALETAQEFAEFKEKTNDKLDRLLEMVSVIKGQMEK